MTETGVGTDEHTTGGFRLPATLALPIEALSMFQTKTPTVLMLQLIREGYFRIRRQKTMWQKIQATGAVARVVMIKPLVLLFHSSKAYYLISLAELHNRYMDVVIVPWVKGMGLAVGEETAPRCIPTTPAEEVHIESRREQIERLLALRCNAVAVAAVLP